MKNRLQTIRKAFGYTQEHVASYVNIGQSTYSCWESGKVKVSTNDLVKLAKLYNVSADLLAGIPYRLRRSFNDWYDDEKEDYENANNFEKILLEYRFGRPIFLTSAIESEEDCIPYESNNGVAIPVLGRVAAGIPISAITDIEDFEEIPKAMAARGDYFALRIRGTSMEPRIADGDIVIVRKQEEAETGDIVIVNVGFEDATCKKIKITPEGVTLLPFNQQFEPLVFSCAEVRELPLRILGKVVELRRKI